MGQYFGDEHVFGGRRGAQSHRLFSDNAGRRRAAHFPEHTLTRVCDIIYPMIPVFTARIHGGLLNRAQLVLNLYIPPIVAAPARVIVVTFTFDRRNGIIYGNNSLITSRPINVTLNGAKYVPHFRLMQQLRHILMSLPIAPDASQLYVRMRRPINRDPI